MTLLFRQIAAAFSAVFVALVWPHDAVAGTPPTIDMMVSSQLINQQYLPDNGFFPLLEGPNAYDLSDGTSWLAGAGTMLTGAAMLRSLQLEGDTFAYKFELPWHFLMLHLDAGIGVSNEYWTRGTLLATERPILYAKQGSTEATLTGFLKVVANVPRTSAFVPFSAPVGSLVYFETHYHLTNAEFTRTLFDRQFLFDVDSFVDFTHVQAVPEPSSSSLLGLGLALTMCLGAWRRMNWARGLESYAPGR